MLIINMFHLFRLFHSEMEHNIMYMQIRRYADVQIIFTSAHLHICTFKAYRLPYFCLICLRIWSIPLLFISNTVLSIIPILPGGKPLLCIHSR